MAKTTYDYVLTRVVHKHCFNYVDKQVTLTINDLNKMIETKQLNDEIKEKIKKILEI